MKGVRVYFLFFFVWYVANLASVFVIIVLLCLVFCNNTLFARGDDGGHIAHKAGNIPNDQ